MRKLLLLLLSIITLTFYNCSNKNLDRGNAFDIIEEFYEYPNVEIISFQGVTSSKKLNEDYYDLRAGNYISEKRKGKYGNEFWVKMTNKGKGFVLSGEASYNGYKVASSVLKLNEITGIRFNDSKNTAFIDYNLKRTDITPFGLSKKYNNGDLITKTTTLQLYDDGWRVNDKKITSIKKDEFLGFNESFIKEIEKKEEELKIAKSKIDIYEGTIKNYPIVMELTFYQNEEEYDCDRGGSIIEGFYYYKKSGSENKLKVKGTSCGASLQLSEFDNNDNWTGDFIGIINDSDLEGSWSNEKRNFTWNMKYLRTTKK